MLSLVTRIMQGIQQSRALRYQAETKRIQATAARNQANAQAALIEDSARRNALIDADNLMTAAANKREATAAIKNKRATSGFTSEGTADAPIRTAAQELQAEIEQMALSSSINSLNAVQTATDTRRQGELTAMVHELEATSLRTQAKGIQRATITNGIIGAAASIYGFSQGLASADEANMYLAEDLVNKRITKSEYNEKLQNRYLSAFATSGYYGSTAYDATAAFNPYTTTMTRKNPWGNLYTLAKGANPGITRSNYSQLFTR